MSAARKQRHGSLFDPIKQGGARADQAARCCGQRPLGTQAPWSPELDKCVHLHSKHGHQQRLNLSIYILLSIYLSSIHQSMSVRTCIPSRAMTKMKSSTNMSR